MRTLYRLVAVLLFPLVVMSVATEPRFSSHYTEGVCGFSTSTVSASMRVLAPNSPSPGSSGQIGFEIFDSQDNSWVRVGGSVPATLFKVRGNTISVDIPDVREFIGSELFVEESGHPGPLPVRATVTATLDWDESLKSIETTRGPLPEGGFRNSWSRYTTASALGAGEIAGYVFTKSAGSFTTGDHFSRYQDVSQESYCRTSTCLDARRSIALADAHSNWSRQNDTFTYYESSLPGIYALIGMDVPDMSTTGFVVLMLWDQSGRPAPIQASGYLPVSVFKVTGTMVSVNIADLRQYVSPAFFLDDGGYFGPIPVKLTSTSRPMHTRGGQATSTALRFMPFRKRSSRRVRQPSQWCILTPLAW
jgi:hypothetical protein